MPIPRAVTRVNRDLLNPVMRRLVGRGPFAELEHVGRRSGDLHRTPLLGFRRRSGRDDIVTIALTYGPEVDWLENLTAAGGGRLELGGRTLQLGAPRRLEEAQGLRRMPLAPRRLLPVLGCHDFVELAVLDDRPARSTRHAASAVGTSAGRVRLGDDVPVVPDDAWVAPGATLVGRVVLHPGASVWYGSVLRADQELVEIGAGSNLQDLCVVHVDPGHPVVVGSGVSVGHGAVLHGCTVEDDVLVGMRSTVMNGARIGRGSIVAAGAVVLEGTQVPPGSLVAGVPAKVRKQLGDEELAAIRRNAEHYGELVARHRGAEPA